MREKIMIIPDSFKGSMSSQEVTKIIEEEAKRENLYDCISIPIADGGEGSVDSILSAAGGTKKYVTVQSPENQSIQAFYGITPQGAAIIEIAESSGLTKQTSYQTKKATTYGFGQLILDALEQNCQTIYLCLGGSATTDCGCGMAAALGIRFYDETGKEFIPVGETLSQIKKIDFEQLDSRIQKTTFVVMSDVESPLYGEKGAAYVFAPQKGASKEEVELLDEGLRNVCRVLKETTRTDYSTLKGGGAAGGAGCGCCAFLGAEMRSGIEAMLDICEFDEKKKDCSLIITGEGKLDHQSLMGKVISGIRAHAGNIPMVAFCGICDMSTEERETIGITVIEIGRGIPLEESMKKGSKYLREKARAYFEQELHKKGK